MFTFNKTTSTSAVLTIAALSLTSSSAFASTLKPSCCNKGCCDESCGKPLEVSQLPARWIHYSKGNWFVKAGQKAPYWLESYDLQAKAPASCCTSGKDCCTAN